MSRCLDLTRLPKSKGLISINFKHTTPGSSSYLLAPAGFINRIAVVDPTHPWASEHPKAFMRRNPFFYNPTLSMRCVPKALLAVPDNQRTGSPFKLSKNSDKRRVDMSLQFAAGKKVMKSAVARHKTKTRIITALQMIVTRGASVKDVNGKKRLVMDEEDAGAHWVLNDWTYLFQPSADVLYTSYADLITLIRTGMMRINKAARVWQQTWEENKEATKKTEDEPMVSQGEHEQLLNKNVKRKGDSASRSATTRHKDENAQSKPGLAQGTHEKQKEEANPEKQGSSSRHQLRHEPDQVSTSEIPGRHQELQLPNTLPHSPRHRPVPEPLEVHPEASKRHNDSERPAASRPRIPHSSETSRPKTPQNHNASKHSENPSSESLQSLYTPLRPETSVAEISHHDKSHHPCEELGSEASPHIYEHSRLPEDPQQELQQSKYGSKLSRPGASRNGNESGRSARPSSKGFRDRDHTEFELLITDTLNLRRRGRPWESSLRSTHDRDRAEQGEAKIEREDHSNPSKPPKISQRQSELLASISKVSRRGDLDNPLHKSTWFWKADQSPENDRSPVTYSALGEKEIDEMVGRRPRYTLPDRRLYLPPNQDSDLHAQQNISERTEEAEISWLRYEVGAKRSATGSSRSNNARLNSKETYRQGNGRGHPPHNILKAVTRGYPDSTFSQQSTYPIRPETNTLEQASRTRNRTWRETLQAPKNKIIPDMHNLLTEQPGNPAVPTSTSKQETTTKSGLFGAPAGDRHR